VALSFGAVADLEDFRRITFNATPDQHRWLTAVAARRRISMAVLLRELIERAQTADQDREKAT